MKSKLVEVILSAVFTLIAVVVIFIIGDFAQGFVAQPLATQAVLDQVQSTDASIYSQAFSIYQPIGLICYIAAGVVFIAGMIITVKKALSF